MALSTTRLRWHRRHETPAFEYAAGPYEIRWDPAGPVEGEPGGWYLWDVTRLIGVYPRIAEAKAQAEAER
jgi:hypothetical protein